MSLLSNCLNRMQSWQRQVATHYILYWARSYIKQWVFVRVDWGGRLSYLMLKSWLVPAPSCIYFTKHADITYAGSWIQAREYILYATITAVVVVNKPRSAAMYRLDAVNPFLCVRRPSVSRCIRQSNRLKISRRALWQINHTMKGSFKGSLGLSWPSFSFITLHWMAQRTCHTVVIPFMYPFRCSWYICISICRRGSWDWSFFSRWRPMAWYLDLVEVPHLSS